MEEEAPTAGRPHDTVSSLKDKAEETVLENGHNNGSIEENEQNSNSNETEKQNGEVNIDEQKENGHSSTIKKEQVENEEEKQEEKEEEKQEEKEVFPDLPETREEEKRIIKEIEADPASKMKEGDTWYVIAIRWWKEWKDFVNYDYHYSSFSRNRPGPIDNTPIIEQPDIDIKPGEELINKTAQENYDFYVLPPKAWKTLHRWYGGGPPLPRSIISSHSYPSSSLKVEVRQLTLKIIKSSDLAIEITASFSKAATIAHLKNTMCNQLELNPDNIRVWDYHNHGKFKLLDDLRQKLEAVQILDGQPILLEEKGQDGTWPEIKNRGYNSYSTNYYSSEPTEPGTVGMANLGNTCFMNSSLQCLSKTMPLTNFFLDNKYKDDINLDNPLGMRGELAEEYSSLLKDLWSGANSVISPRDFKWKLERFAPQFAGYQQHDSQELLGFLLDGLHEDLNRIKKKPYKELKDPANRPDQEVADEMWEYHKMRNDSIVVDWFQGQLKSTLVCPKCSKVSITYDPFMYLSLPLPIKSTRTLSLVFFYYSATKKPLQIAVEVDKAASIKTLKQSIATLLTDVKPSSIEICDIYSNRIYKLFDDKESVDMIQDRDIIHAYELLITENGKEEEEEYKFPILFRKIKTTTYGSYYSYPHHNVFLFGNPTFLCLPNANNLTYKQLYEIVYKHFQRFLKISPSLGVIRTLDQLDSKDPSTLENSKEEVEEEAVNSTSQTEKQKREEEEEEEEGDTDPRHRKNSVDKENKTPLFTVIIVDQQGNPISNDKLIDNDLPLNLKDGSCLGITFSEEIAEKFYDFLLDRDYEIHPSYRRTSEPNEEQDSITLQQCIDLFTTTEQLGPDDPWYCSNCKEHQQATKKFDLWRLPPILVVHLKRFSYKNRYYREKLETFVDYPLNDLDLSPWLKGASSDSPIYNLYAVSNHYGSLGGGHYTAYAQNKDGKWYRFDDRTVSPIEKAQVNNSSSGYVLFYQRKDTIQTPSQAATSNSTPNTSDSPSQQD